MNKRIKNKHQKRKQLHDNLLLIEHIISWQWLPDFSKMSKIKEAPEETSLYNKDTGMWQWTKPLNEQ